MHLESDKQLDELGQRFLDSTIAKEEWTHGAHIAVTVYFLRKYPDLVAESSIPDLIRALNVSQGVRNTETEGYHHTITLASIGAVRTFLSQHAALSAHECVNALLDSPVGKSSWLRTHWSAELLFTPKARLEWTPPDREPLGFEVVVTSSR